MDREDFNLNENESNKNIDDTESQKLADEIEEENEEEMGNTDITVLNELVEDMSYFYKEDDDVLTNEKLKTKHKIFQIGLIVGLLFISIFILGGVRMAMYQTTEVVNNQLIYKQTFAKNSKDCYQYAIGFADEYNVMIYLDTINNQLDVNDVNDKINNYQNTIDELESYYDKINENDKYEIYVNKLKIAYSSMAKIINAFEPNKAYDSQSDTFKAEMKKFVDKTNKEDIIDELVSSACVLDYFDLMKK